MEHKTFNADARFDLGAIIRSKADKREVWRFDGCLNEADGKGWLLISVGGAPRFGVAPGEGACVLHATPDDFDVICDGIFAYARPTADDILKEWTK